jgi:hypothetical protein
MVYSQVDPARLSGDALRRWYLRSPDEIAQERSAASTRAYDRFFSGSATASRTRPDAASPLHSADGPHDATILWTANSANGWQGRRADLPVIAAISQRYAVSAPANGAGCKNCHGGLEPPALPLPWQWSGDRLLRDTPNSPPSKPPERDRKQCELQLEFDTDICNGQATEEAKAVCHASASNRYAHCRRTGEVDTPYLSTFRRSPRRR